MQKVRSSHPQFEGQERHAEAVESFWSMVGLFALSGMLLSFAAAAVWTVGDTMFGSSL